MQSAACKPVHALMSHIHLLSNTLTQIHTCTHTHAHTHTQTHTYTNQGCGLLKIPGFGNLPCSGPNNPEQGKWSGTRSQNVKSRLQHRPIQKSYHLHDILFHNKIKDKIENTSMLSMFIDKYIKERFI